jgi:hypothetical protein
MQLAEKMDWKGLIVSVNRISECLWSDYNILEDNYKKYTLK